MWQEEVSKSECLPEGEKEASCLLGEGHCKARGGQLGQFPLWLDDFVSVVPPWGWEHELLVVRNESRDGCGRPLEHAGQPGNDTVCHVLPRKVPVPWSLSLLGLYSLHSNEEKCNMNQSLDLSS